QGWNTKPSLDPLHLFVIRVSTFVRVLDVRFRRYKSLLPAPMSKQVLIIGAGVIGLSTAYYAARKGHQVAVLDRGTIVQENCSYGNAGLVVPSHLVPLAAPGMVAQGLKWMLKPD